MKKLLFAACLLADAPAFAMACSIDDGLDNGGGGAQRDLSLDADIAAQRHEAQKAVDRNIRARQELADSNAELDAFEQKVAAGAQDALDFVRTYRNPTVANPAPIAPDVAEQPPAVEPPVFTSIDSTELADGSTSGGVVDAIGDGFTLSE